MFRRRSRLVIPVMAVLVGIYLLIGCIPIPATRQLQPDLTPRPEHYVGKRKDDPVRIGYTHIDDAFVFLSQHVKPYHGSTGLFSTGASGPEGGEFSINRWSVTYDRRRFSLQYSIRTATWIAPLCFTAWADIDQRWITFDVDENGVITGSTTTDHPIVGSIEEPGRWLEIFDAPTRRKLYDAAVFPSDETLRRQQSAREENLRWQRKWETTRPATQP